MIRFHLGCVKISISIYFLGICALLPMFDMTGGIFLALAACFLHEAGHMLLLFAFYRGEASLHLGLFGMRLTVDEMRFSNWHEICFALVGPLFNFLACLSAVLLHLDSRWFFFNFFVGAFNLLPVLPLDGGTVLRIVLDAFMKEGHAKRTSEVIGILTLMALVVVLVYLFINSQFNVTLLIAILYITILMVKN